ncbi:MAG: hypothetical protein ACE14P_11865 [Methanotrichaceae archaeon]
MRGLLVAMLIISIFAILDGGAAKSPIGVPLQYGQFCDVQKIAGKGITDISTSIDDSEISLGYHSSLAGNGDIEIDQVSEYSQNAEKLLRKVDALNDTNESSLNLFENLKLAYSGSVPLVGEKGLSSAIGAYIQENFNVNEIEKEQTAFITSTGNKSRTGHLPYYNPVHTMGINTKNTFNGTWGTDTKWHKMLSRDIKSHEMFSGKFEAEKLIKFHENPISEKKTPPCSGIDC